ncbi:MAG: MipA/OmpV family protein, partial [Enterobacteriaceae bacterium]
LCCSTNLAQGADISLGVAGNMSLSPYKAKHADYTALPIFNYDNDIVYFAGAEGGVYLLNGEEHEITLKALYQGKQYDSSDGSGAAMRKLHDRRDTLMTGINYQYTAFFGALTAEVLADTLNHSKGVTASVSYINQLQFQEITLLPSLALNYHNGQQNRYFYGISASESARSGLRAYRPKQSISPAAALMVSYQMTPQWQSYLSSEAHFLPSTVRNSPMIDRDMSYSFTLGLNYHF